MKENKILYELKKHVPFTLFGAFTGIIIMLFFYNVSSNIAFSVFYILHPIHVLLSALVTASIYRKYANKINIYILLLIGYMGSIGIATISDSIIPYIGELIIGLPNAGVHLGFIEKWWLVNPLAILGIIIAYFYPSTKFSHTGHVLLSTWASLFHILMHLNGEINLILGVIVFIFLFFAVWLPCCLSDIVFPLLFVRNKK